MNTIIKNLRHPLSLLLALIFITSCGIDEKSLTPVKNVEAPKDPFVLDTAEIKMQPDQKLSEDTWEDFQDFTVLQIESDNQNWFSALIEDSFLRIW